MPYPELTSNSEQLEPGFNFLENLNLASASAKIPKLVPVQAKIFKLARAPTNK